jgi:hypothetical protein
VKRSGKKRSRASQNSGWRCVTCWLSYTSESAGIS